MLSRRYVILSMCLVASASGVPTENENVRFDVIASRSMEVPPTIDVTLNGVKDGLELTHYRMNDESAVGCNYLGYLRNIPSSSVAVTGCLNKPGDRMEVTMISENNVNKMFTVDFNGNAEIIKSPFEEGATSRAIKSPKIRLANRNFDDNQGDEILDDEEEEQVATAPLSSIPSKLKAVIKFGYEDGLNSALAEDFDSWIAGVFTHTQAHFRHAASLGTTVEFEVQGAAVYNQGATWTADDNIYDARDATNALGLDGVDVMSWWCERGGGGVAGIAFLGALCSTYNTNLNEKQWNAAGSGFVLAHELGHNFGMSHDFDDKHGGDSSPCNGQGIMSYGSYSYDQWSTCSKSDWEEHYSGMNWGQGCLEDISDETTVAPTDAPTAAPTDAPTAAPPTGGSWIHGHKCPYGTLTTEFEGDLGYNLETAKELCASGCNARVDCLFADLYYTSSYQTCYLDGNECGSWESNTHPSYYLYQKGSPDPDCVDIAPVENCQRRQGKGHCDSGDFTKWAYNRCKSTCGLCGCTDSPRWKDQDGDGCNWWRDSCADNAVDPNEWTAEDLEYYGFPNKHCCGCGRADGAGPCEPDPCNKPGNAGETCAVVDNEATCNCGALPCAANEKCLDGSCVQCHSTANGATDTGDDRCSWYTVGNRWMECGNYDDEDFTANEMCCGCGGGGLMAK